MFLVNVTRPMLLDYPTVKYLIIPLGHHRPNKMSVISLGRFSLQSSAATYPIFWPSPSGFDGIDGSIATGWY